MSYTDFDFPHTHFYDSDLRELLYKVTKILGTVKELDEWKRTHEKEYEELQEAWDAFEKGDWSPELTATMTKWATDNLKDIIGELMIKSVFFEITDAGNFIAYIPESWEEIIFNTTEYDYNTPLQTQYGHLVLSY